MTPSRMTVKKAREIVDSVAGQTMFREEFPEGYFEAVGFLDAIERVKPLVQALEKIENYKVKLYDEERTLMDVIVHDKQETKAALAQWRELMGEGS